jgi:alkaline phosphatase D
MQETAPVSPSSELDFTVKFNLTGLTPKTHYSYRAVVEGNIPGSLCRFVTAPIPEDPATVTFVIGGDMRETFRPFTIMEEMRSAKADFFVFLGDTIYSDKENAAIQLSEYWAKYRTNRDMPTQRFLAETSVLVMWDDHEVDNDFLPTHPRMPIGRKAFFDYWPLRPDPQDSPRLYRSFRWGQAVELFLLDTRQYRDLSAHTMLGAAQKQWLKDSLASTSATIKFIATSVPFSDPREDKWGEYQQERDEILEFIDEMEIAGVVFLTADVHHAAVAKVPGPLGLKEFIFGPLATTMNYKIASNEPRFEYFNDQSQNYGKITVKPGPPQLSVEIKWFDRCHHLLHRVEFGEDLSNTRVTVGTGK